MRRNTSPRKAPGSPLGAKFRNFRRQVLEMRWDDGSKEGVYSGTIPALGPTSTLSYQGHTFFFTYQGQEIARFLMEAGVNLYIIHPAPDDAETFASPAYQHAKEEHRHPRGTSTWVAATPRRARARARTFGGRSGRLDTGTRS